MFFNSWSSMGRILLVGTLAYFALVLLLRISGKRTLSKMNAFDMVITVAIGSTLASAVLDSNTALIDGIFAFALLIGLQFTITWLSVRSKVISRLVKSEPKLLFYDGQFLRSAMKNERVTEPELLAAVRSEGLSDLHQVQAIILETQGEVNVIAASSNPSRSALADVRNPNPDATNH